MPVQCCKCLRRLLVSPARGGGEGLAYRCTELRCCSIFRLELVGGRWASRQACGSSLQASSNCPLCAAAALALPLALGAGLGRPRASLEDFSTLLPMNLRASEQGNKCEHLRMQHGASLAAQ